jgi:hypothetical protein
VEYQHPAWVTPQPKKSRLSIYLAATMLLAIVIGGVLFARSQLTAMQAGNDEVVQASPTPLLSDFERADRFMNLQLTPAFAALITPLQNAEKDCSPKTMTAPCKTDLIALNSAMITGQKAFDQADIPVCIGREVGQFKNDWMGMEQGITEAISGYTDNSYDLYFQGMVAFAEIAQYMKPDLDRITAAEKTCSTVTPGK